MARDWLCTASTSALTCSGGVNWLMPWPRLKMCVGPVVLRSVCGAPKLSSTVRTCAAICSGWANSTFGSMLPCSALPGPPTLPPAMARARPKLAVQSRPSTSQSRAFISSSQMPPPLVKTMRGTSAPSGPVRFNCASTRFVYSRLNCWKAPSASTPPQLSKTITACAPASICAFRYCATESALIARMRCIRSGRAYISVLTAR